MQKKTTTIIRVCFCFEHIARRRHLLPARLCRHTRAQQHRRRRRNIRVVRACLLPSDTAKDTTSLTGPLLARSNGGGRGRGFELPLTPLSFCQFVVNSSSKKGLETGEFRSIQNHLRISVTIFNFEQVCTLRGLLGHSGGHKTSG